MPWPTGAVPGLTIISNLCFVTFKGFPPFDLMLVNIGKSPFLFDISSVIDDPSILEQCQATSEEFIPHEWSDDEFASDNSDFTDYEAYMSGPDDMSDEMYDSNGEFVEEDI